MTSGRVLLIRAGSRGQGSSYVTAGLVRTARAQQQRVLAIDAAAPTGNLADLLEIPHATPFAVFAHAPTELLDRVTHNASGVAVLPLTDGVSDDPLSREAVRTLVPAARTAFDLVVIDGGDGFGDLASAWVDLVDRVCVVSDASDRGIARARAVMRGLGDSGVPSDALHWCINRASAALPPRARLAPAPTVVLPQLPGPLTPPDGDTDTAFRRLWLALDRPTPGSAATASDTREIEAAMDQVRRRLVSEVRLSQGVTVATHDRHDRAVLREQLRPTVMRLVDELLGPFVRDPEDRRQKATEILDDAVGYGCLEPLLADPTVTEIMVNRYDQIFVERDGRVERSTSRVFANELALRAVIDRMLSAHNRRVDESAPKVDAILRDGSRINVIIPPLSRNGPVLTIRKFPTERLTVAHLIGRGSLTQDMADFLRLVVSQRQNIVVAGGAGAGKTTLLNVLAAFIADHDRVITIEDAAELLLQQGHVVPLESRPPNLEGVGAVTQLDLLVNALRMRPDRIIVGECRGNEAFAMLQAMNTGHEGSLTSVHANNELGALLRIEAMVQMTPNPPPASTVRQQIASSIHYIVQQSRQSDGRRCVVAITEVVGRLENENYILNPVFKFDRHGIDTSGRVLGRFLATGHVPALVSSLRAEGQPVPLELFTPGEGA